MKIEPIDSTTHEFVFRIEDAATGLLGFIALHSTRLGPAAGGLRMRPYDNEQTALDDVLRLSEGMSFKNAAADLPLGGGKAVIIGDPHIDGKANLLRLFGRAIQSLDGRYWTAEDMGMTPADMEVLAEVTDFVAGLPNGKFASGDPSSITARGVLNGIKTSWAHKTGRDDLSGVRIAVQGLGNVGRNLCALLQEAGAQLFVTDMSSERTEQAVRELGAQAVPLEEIYDVDADVFSPCAIGGVLTSDVIGRLKVRVVAGGANNQLPTDAEGDWLHNKDILYAPDFVTNGGGIINVASEILEVSDRADWVARHLEALNCTLDQILEQSKIADMCPNRVAKEVVARKLDAKH